MYDNTELLHFSASPQIIHAQLKETTHFGNHLHNFYEIEIVLSGHGDHILNGERYEWRRGEMHLTRLTDVHRGVIDELSTVYNIQFAPSRMPDDVLRRLKIKSGGFVAYLSEDELEAVSALSDRLIAEMTDMRSYAEYIAEHLLCSILYIFLRAYGEKEEKEEKLPPSHIVDIISYVGEHYKEKISLDDVAEAVFMNKNYLCTYFKKKMGKTLLAYIRDLRLETAARLATLTDLRSIDICERSGYTSISHFLRDFKQKYGISPTEMREKALNQQKKEKKT